MRTPTPIEQRAVEKIHKVAQAIFPALSEHALPFYDEESYVVPVLVLAACRRDGRVIASDVVTPAAVDDKKLATFLAGTAALLAGHDDGGGEVTAIEIYADSRGCIMSADEAFNSAEVKALKSVVDATFSQIIDACAKADDGKFFVVPVLVLAAISHADGKLRATKTSYPLGQDTRSISALLASAHRTLNAGDLAPGETRQ